MCNAPGEPRIPWLFVRVGKGRSQGTVWIDFLLAWALFSMTWPGLQRAWEAGLRAAQVDHTVVYAAELVRLRNQIRPWLAPASAAVLDQQIAAHVRQYFTQGVWKGPNAVSGGWTVQWVGTDGAMHAVPSP